MTTTTDNPSLAHRVLGPVQDLLGALIWAAVWMPMALWLCGWIG